ncbi:HmuY family protein [uncultured Microscilla sp.]|uniref:HmuY family protein n=1 Tax=uncultured Microscilla sp. TaxID=432653 RepID=UPI0026169C50|nr:HmuY family protein [uncultured Microscilla sp.]
MTRFSLIFLMVAGVLLTCTACKKEASETVIPPLETKTHKNLAAPGDVVDRATGKVIQENPYVYFSLEKGTTVSKSENWDIGFKGTSIIFNSGISGSGQAGAVIKTGVFEELTTAPESEEFRQDSNEGLAVPAGSNNGWYNYAGPPSHLITPIAGKVIMVKTFDGKYAKVEILSYYKDAPATPDAFKDQSATYTFRYMYQADGSKNLK